MRLPLLLLALVFLAAGCGGGGGGSSQPATQPPAPTDFQRLAIVGTYTAEHQLSNGVFAGQTADNTAVLGADNTVLVNWPTLGGGQAVAMTLTSDLNGTTRFDGSFNQNGITYSVVLVISNTLTVSCNGNGSIRYNLIVTGAG